MSTIAVIGLGVTGAPTATNLLGAGHQIVGYNYSRGKVDAFLSAGGAGAESAAEAVHGADIIVTVLPHSPEVEAVAGDEGILAHAKPGALW